MWQNAYVQRNSFGQNFESLGCLFHFSRSSKTEMFGNVKANVNMFAETARWKLKLTDEHGGKVWTRRHSIYYTDAALFLSLSFSSSLTSFSRRFLSDSLAFYLLSSPLSQKNRGEMKNDLVDKGRRDKWPSKSLPFEPSSNFMLHQNTIVPKSKPPHWSKSIAVHKSPLMKCSVSVWREGLFIYTEFSFIKVMHG